MPKRVKRHSRQKVRSHRKHNHQCAQHKPFRRFSDQEQFMCQLGACGCWATQAKKRENCQVGCERTKTQIVPKQGLNADGKAAGKQPIWSLLLLLNSLDEEEHTDKSEKEGGKNC